MVIHLKTLQAVRSGNGEQGMHLPAGPYLILDPAGLPAGLCCLVFADLTLQRRKEQEASAGSNSQSLQLKKAITTAADT